MIVTILLLHLAICEGTFSGQTLSKIFGSEICIPGSLSSIHLKTTDAVYPRDLQTDLRANVLNMSQDKSVVTEKSALTNLHELAQFNDIKYIFKLQKEEGPPHQKKFTLSLTLGDENYIAESTSLKSAQQKAAYNALQNTEYQTPPLKENYKNVASLTPTVLLNNLCTKLGLYVKYISMDEDKQNVVGSSIVSDKKTKKSYLQILNDTVYAGSNIHVRKDLPQSNGPFQIKLQVGDNVFYGVAHSKQAAKHEAATNALEYLIRNKDNMNLACDKDGSEEECQRVKETMKSPISLVYEAAQLRKIDINFEVIDEHGPAHKKTFITECRLGHLTTTGEGKSKKESKRAAAESMMQRIKELEPVSYERQVNGIMKDKQKRKKKKSKIIKTKLEEISMVANDILNSVLGYGKNEESDNQVDEDGNAFQTKRKKHGKEKYSYQQELLELSNSLNFEIQYTDFVEENKHYSILSLLIDPEYICYGFGLGEKEARSKAAYGGINLLYSIGLYDHFPNKDSLSIERETKEQIDIILKENVENEKE